MSIYAPDPRSLGSHTLLPPPPNHLSSSVKNSPPKSIEVPVKNWAKITKHLDKLDGKLSKVKRTICRVLEHLKGAFESGGGGA